MKISTKTKQGLRGFTLIEMIVSVALFTVVMLVSLTSLITIVDADHKAQSLQSVIDNLNFALDDMSRTIRTGMNYHCSNGSSGSDTFPLMGDPTAPQNCISPGSSYIALEGSHGNTSDSMDQIVYYFAPRDVCGTNFASGCIMRSEHSGASGTFLPITAPDIGIESARFYVQGACTLFGSEAGCSQADKEMQPRVIIIITARIKTPGGTPAVLHLQTTLTQRVYDA